MSDFDITLDDVESVRIRTVPLGGAEIIIRRDGGQDIIGYEEPIDQLYEQLIEAELIEYE